MERLYALRRTDIRDIRLRRKWERKCLDVDRAKSLGVVHCVELPLQI